MTCLCCSLFFSVVLLLLIHDDLLFSPFFVQHTVPTPKPRPRYDYAASDPGGKIVAHSRDLYGAKGILKPDKDKYLLVPCAQREKWVEISLLEDILIDEVQFIQGEIYSSSFKSVEIQYSIEFPTDQWEHLVTVNLDPGNSPQKFRVDNVWVRFLKLLFWSHYGNEYYCTLSQFSVFGSTILQNLSEDYLKQREEVYAAVKNLTVLEDGELVEKGGVETGIVDSGVCRPTLYYYNFTCENKGDRLEIFDKNKEFKAYFNVFGEMVKHMSQTELKIEQLTHICSRMERAQRNYDEKLKLIEKHLMVLELELVQSRESIENLQFWMIFFVVLFFIAMLLIIYVSGKTEKNHIVDSDSLRSETQSLSDETFSDYQPRRLRKKLKK